MPVNYEAARKAIALCVEIDECKDWADKAAAIASYAKQSRDATMRDAATRIQLRAEERLGELLASIPKGTAIFSHEKNKMVPNYNGKWATARRAGVTNAQYYRATHIAAVPKKKRDKAIEASPPIRPHVLAAMSVKLAPDTSGRKSEPSYAHVHAGGEVGRLIRYGHLHPARQSGVETSLDDANYIRKHFRKLVEWLDEFEQCLPKGASK